MEGFLESVKQGAKSLSESARKLGVQSAHASHTNTELAAGRFKVLVATHAGRTLTGAKASSDPLAHALPEGARPPEREGLRARISDFHASRALFARMVLPLETFLKKREQAELEHDELAQIFIDRSLVFRPTVASMHVITEPVSSQRRVTSQSLLRMCVQNKFVHVPWQRICCGQRFV